MTISCSADNSPIVIPSFELWNPHIQLHTHLLHPSTEWNLCFVPDTHSLSLSAARASQKPRAHYPLSNYLQEATRILLKSTNPTALHSCSLMRSQSSGSEALLAQAHVTWLHNQGCHHAILPRALSHRFFSIPGSSPAAPSAEMLLSSPSPGWPPSHGRLNFKHTTSPERRPLPPL